MVLLVMTRSLILHVPWSFALAAFAFNLAGHACVLNTSVMSLILYNPMDCSPPGSTVHRIPQVRILEWVAMPYSRGSSQCRDWTHVTCMNILAPHLLLSGSLVTKSCPTLGTPWTVACQVLLSRRFSRQEYWSGLPFLSPGNLPNPGIKPWPPHCRPILYWLSYKRSSRSWIAEQYMHFHYL